MTTTTLMRNAECGMKKAVVHSSFFILHSSFFLEGLSLLIAPSRRLLLAQERRNDGLVAPIPTTITTEATAGSTAPCTDPGTATRTNAIAIPRGVGDFYLLCDFNPDNRDNASDDFGACLTLARYLRDLHKKQGVQVIAYVHGKVTRHAVLPVLACSEIILSQDPPAQLGKVADAEHPLERLDRLAYDELANQRYPSVLIRKMYDAGRRGPQGARWAVPRRQRQADVPRACRFPASAAARRPCIPSPRPAISVCASRSRATASTKCASAISCRPPACIRRWTASSPGVSSLRGPINGEIERKVKRRVRKRAGQKANLLILELACGDGESQAAHELAVFLTELNDNRREPVETIAYVTGQARNTAAFLAFACNKIVMQREIKQDGRSFRKVPSWATSSATFRSIPTLEATIRRNLADIAATQALSAILAEGMLDRDLRIVAVESTKEESARKYISEAELKADQQGEQRWRSVGVVKPSNDEGRGQISHADGGPGPRSRRGPRGGRQFRGGVRAGGRQSRRTCTRPIPTGWTVWSISSAIRGRA